MRTGNQRKQIIEVLAICKDHWRSSGITENEIELLAEEAEEDLQYATDNGQDLSEVVGYDVRKFADSYAGNGELDSPRERFMVGVFVAVLLIIVAGGIGFRLTNWLGGSLPWYLVVGLSITAAIVLVFWTGSRKDGRNRP